MSKPLFDHEALIGAFEKATARQGAQLRETVQQATLQALQGREMTLKNVRSALKSVAEAASAGLAHNPNPGIDPVALLDKAVAGMDDALLKAVAAHRTALGQLAAHGADLRDKHLKKALGDLERFEDSVFDALRKAAAGAGAPLGEAWTQVMTRLQAGGTASGMQAAATAEQMVAQLQSAVKNSRSAGLRAAQVMAESYAAVVSGVLMGMSQAMEPAPPPKASAARKTR